MAFFIPLTCVTLSFLLYHIPLLFTKNNKLWSKKKDFFVYMTASAYHVTSKEVENRVFKHNRIFRHTSMYKQPKLTT